MTPDLQLAISFARLELRELECGLRTLTQCPGVENVAAAIEEAQRTDEDRIGNADLDDGC